MAFFKISVLYLWSDLHDSIYNQAVTITHSQGKSISAEAVSNDDEHLWHAECELVVQSGIDNNQ